jgi:hypothetical protein
VDTEVDLVAGIAELPGQQVPDALLDQRAADPGSQRVPENSKSKSGHQPINV